VTAPRRSSDVDPARLLDHLRDRLPERADLRLDGVRRIVGGMSRRTHFVDVSWQGAQENRLRQTLNLRSDHPGLTTFTVPLSYEFEILRRLHPTDIPVAEPYWYETDPDVLGFAPFYFREVVPGSAQSKPLFAPGAEEQRRSLGRQVVTQLARLHTLDWEALGFDEFMSAPAGPADAHTHALDHWESFYRAHAVEPRPMIHEVFGRIRRLEVPPPDRVSLTWGDVGIGQFIYEGDRLTALTDFEMAGLGDPMMDWAAALTRGLPDLLPRDEAFDLYEQESGIAIDPERIDHCTLIAATSCFCWHPLLLDLTDAPPVDAALTRLGAGLDWQWLDICQRLLEGR
jgi:aminoglycoside phosphotransferase (APT) family kinase protein